MTDKEAKFRQAFAQQSVSCSTIRFLCRFGDGSCQIISMTGGMDEMIKSKYIQEYWLEPVNGIGRNIPTLRTFREGPSFQMNDRRNVCRA